MLVEDQPGFNYTPKKPSNSLICGIGVNNANYVIKPSVGPNCQVYQAWKSMISRCYNPRVLDSQPAYNKVTVCADWLIYSNFRAWAEQFEYIDRVLDKDLLSIGSVQKQYSKDSCCFIPAELNSFLVLRKSKQNSSLPIGTKKLKSGKYQSVIYYGGRDHHLGVFDSALEAHLAWLHEKIKVGTSIKSNIQLEDPRVVLGFEKFLSILEEHLVGQKEVISL